MFVLDRGMTHIDLPPDTILSIFESINKPQIVVEGRPPEDSQAFVVSARVGRDSFTLCVYLWLTESHEQLIYVCEPREIAGEAFIAAETEALTFVERLGFMVDDLGYRNLPVDRQRALLRELPVFSPSLSASVPRGGGSLGEPVSVEAAVAVPGDLDLDVTLDLGEPPSQLAGPGRTSPKAPTRDLDQALQALEIVDQDIEAQLGLRPEHDLVFELNEPVSAEDSAQAGDTSLAAIGRLLASY